MNLLRSFLLFVAVPLMAMPLRVVAIGDSHTRVSAGFERALSRELHQEVTYTNYGIIGARTMALVRALEGSGPYSEVLRGLQADVILVAFGTNEAASGVQADVYRKAIQMLKHRYKAKIILVGPPMGDATRLPKLHSVIATQKQVAREFGIPWIDRNVDCGRLPDGVHLTHRGYVELAKHTAKHLSEVLK